MTTKYVGIDSTTFYHDGQTSFRAPLGVAIAVDDYDQFNEKYGEIVNELKKKYRLDTPRTCIKGHYISSKLGSNGGQWFTSDFVEKIMSHLKMVYVNHVIISPTRVTEISYSNGTKVPTMKFVDVLTSSFNHLIAWNLLRDFSDMSDADIYVDYFTGLPTKAWEQLESNEKLYLFSAGEYCNCLISTADLFCKYINDFLYTNREKLGFDGISKAFSRHNITEMKPDMLSGDVEQALNNNTPKLHQSNYSPFNLITPNSKRNLEADLKLKHPVSFVLPSHKLNKEKGILENSPIYDVLTNDAYSNFGCVRSINLDDLQNEVRYMKKGDKIITIGDEALEKATYLKNFGVDIEIVPSNDLLQKQ